MSFVARLVPYLLASALLVAVVGERRSSAQSPALESLTRNASQMAGRIDELLAAAWAREKIEPAALVDDAEFLRRSSLDLTGVIPTVAEVRAFLADNSPGKRFGLVDRLLASNLHADHLATTWRNMMVPRGSTVDGFDGQAGLQNWLRTQFHKNLRYDQLVADLLVSTGAAQQGPGLFYTAFDLKPEELAGNTARVFLGVQIQCAQCHDHPFDHWTQQDFWGYAAFFARLGRAGDGQPGRTMQLLDKRDGEVTLPGTQAIVLPRYPRGDPAPADDFGTRRMQLGIWMVSRDNPFLARAAVNRVWAHMFGRGLVEPVDDLSGRNPASHPQLFDELTTNFIETGYDLRKLLRTLAQTRAYQLASRAETGTPSRPETFARMAVKTFTPEQLYDSLMRAALMNVRVGTTGAAAAVARFDVSRQAFVAKMQSQSLSRLDYDSGVAQVLQLLNGAEVAAATNDPTSGILAALEAPVFSDEERVEILFLATLSRLPEARERTKSVDHLERGKSDNGRTIEALGDILWALVNSAEFGLNH
jgi:hypothetical protein